MGNGEKRHGEAGNGEMGYGEMGAYLRYHVKISRTKIS
jgi:hypothetical protein